MSRVVEFDPDFKLSVDGSFEYVVLLDEELYCSDGDYTSESIRVTKEGELYFTADDYFISDMVEDDIDGIALYLACVKRDAEFEDLTKLAQESYDNVY